MQSRRNFLQFSTLAGLGLTINPLSSLLPVENSPTATAEPGFKPGKGQQVLTLLQTTDVHCQLHPHDELFWENGKMAFRQTGGYAHIATYFKKVRQQNPATFIIDTGDMFQGSMLSVETTGKALQPVLNAMDYNLYLPGNWEVVYYKKGMQKLLGGLDAPKICANMYHDLGGGQKGELIFPPYTTWSAGGVKIGFIGYTDPLVPIRQSPAYSKGIVYTRPEDNLPYYINVLREQEQCQLVIILSHLGLSQQIALANREECRGVDYIFGGDTHERVRKPIQCTYAKVVEPGAFGSFVGRLDLLVENGKIVNEQYSLLEVDPSKFQPDEELVRIIKEAEQPFRQSMDNVIGYSKVPLYRYFVVENTIDTLIIDALKWKVGTDIVLSNGFRFCPPRSKKDGTGNIPITEAFLYDMLPVDSRVRTGKISGRQLKAWLETELNNVFAKEASQRLGGWIVKFKGMKVRFRAFDERQRRIQSMTIDDKPVADEQLYTICACEREGDPPNMLCRLVNVAEPENTPYHLHEVVKEYLSIHSPVAPLPEKNAMVLDAPQNLLTQVTGVDYTFH